MRWAFKIAYDGTRFSGSQRQPELRTVEGDVVRALMDTGSIEDARGAKFQVASRTDRGVSALGNVIAFDSDVTGPKLLSMLNSKCRDVWVLGYAEVGEDFNPRHARMRHYKYLVMEEGLDVKRVREVAGIFQGEHDFRNFCKRDHRDTVRKIEKVEVKKEGGHISIGFMAPSFLWNQVRRMVAAIQGVARGEVALEDVELALSGKDEMDLGMVPPEPLVLWEVDCGVDFVCPVAVGDRMGKDVKERVMGKKRELWLLDNIGKRSRS